MFGCGELGNVPFGFCVEGAIADVFAPKRWVLKKSSQRKLLQSQKFEVDCGRVRIVCIAKFAAWRNYGGVLMTLTWWQGWHGWLGIAGLANSSSLVWVRLPYRTTLINFNHFTTCRPKKGR